MDNGTGLLSSTPPAHHAEDTIAASKLPRLQQFRLAFSLHPCAPHMICRARLGPRQRIADGFFNGANLQSRGYRSRIAACVEGTVFLRHPHWHLAPRINFVFQQERFTEPRQARLWIADGYARFQHLLRRQRIVRPDGVEDACAFGLDH